MTDTPPDLQIETARRSLLERASIVWLIPLGALIIALGVAWHSYADRGPLIEIEFEDGAGIASRQTELRYRNVTVGLVEKVAFTAGLQKVLVSVRVDKDVAPYVTEGSKFWIVRPRVTTRGVSGLDTVLSGVFIEGFWGDKDAPAMTRFQGLPMPPLIQPGQDGLRITLRTAANTSLSGDVPIIYRGVEVGLVGKADISRDGSFATVDAVIFHPYDRLITSTTRFWDASGFSFTLGPSGAAVDFSSLATLIGGGITFDTAVSGGVAVADGAVFEIFPDEAAARANIFTQSDVDPLQLSVIFDDNVPGLAVGAPVELGGLKIGEVSNLTGIVDKSRFGDTRVRLNTTLSLQPARLGLPGEPSPQAALEFLAAQVDGGLRARLATNSILTGGLKVELLTVPAALPATLDLSGDPFPVLPSTDSEISDVTATAEGMFNRINNLPVEDLMTSAIDFLEAARSLIASEDMRKTPQDVRGLIGDIRGLVGSDATQNVPVQLSETLARIDAMVAQLQEAQAVQKLVAAVDAARTTADGIDASIKGVPQLIEHLDAVVAKINDMPLNDLTTELTALLDSANAVAGAEGAEELPAALTGALDEIRTTLATMRQGGLIENANETLASARKAADSLAVSTEDLPALVDRLTALLDQASATVKTYDGRSPLNQNAIQALRDIQAAADAVSSLARAIERRPNSLLLGR